ncbi:MAG: oligosaccharide flippase family protein [Chlorobium sp.]|nr:oligosaccharide flippase family protein [Chlorobium sp.]
MAREKRAILSGGLVAINHVVGAVVTVVSALLLSKVLGPKTFAIYALCTSLSGVLRPVARLGINACLLTQSDEPQADDYQTALATMLACSILVACIAIILLPLIGHFSRIPNLFWPGVATVAILPLHVFSLPAITRLERGLKFRPVVIIELVSQILGQSCGISLAFCGWGIWGPLAGLGVRTIINGIAPWVVMGLRPRVSWDSKNAWRMVKFGFGYVVVTILGQSRSLLLLSIVGRIIGQEAVGYMGLTLRAVGLIAPFRAASARLILPALAPIAHIPDTLRRGVEAVVETELLLSVPVTVFAVAIYQPCVQLLLGPTWQQTASLFPWVAAGSLLMSAHTTSLSVLHIRGYFAESIISTSVGHFGLVVALACLGAFAGLEGCAAATVAVWPLFWIQEWLANRRLGTFWSVNGISWAIGGAAACLSWRLGPWVLILPSVIGVATFTAIGSRFKFIISVIKQR